jgi:alkanesulfonate monooxygenase SsuD/methylene tetrahydromethanopterin reductase-like flavin-dependent oxidoreductase (luciferase family)
MHSEQLTGICFLVSDISDTRSPGRRGPGRPIADLADFLELGPLLAPHFRRVWLSDNFGARSTPVLLAAAAREWPSLSLGSFGSWPYGRNPVDLAALSSSIAELMPGRELILGLSRGNRLVANAFHMPRPVAALRETVDFVHRLMAGDDVAHKDFPTLCEISGLNPESRSRLHMTPHAVPLFIGSTGPRTLEMAGAHADGAIFGTQQPNQSVEAWRRGIYRDTSGLADVARGRVRSQLNQFRLVNSISVCIAQDKNEAISFAKREVAAILATKSDAALHSIGIEASRAAAVRAGFQSGGVGEAVRHISTETVRKLVIAGRPKEVVDEITEASSYAIEHGFDEQFLSLPLGPDLREAVLLITGEVMPALRRV